MDVGWCASHHRSRKGARRLLSFDGSGSDAWRCTQDNKRAENDAGPSSEWWNGLFERENTLNKDVVSVEDYVRPDQLPAEQLRQAEEGHRNRVEQAMAEAAYTRARQKAKEEEEALPSNQKEVPGLHPDTVPCRFVFVA